MVTKPEVHVERVVALVNQITANLIVANDDNYQVALAA